MTRRFRIAIVAAAIVGGVGVPLLPAQAAGTGSISGVAFEDTNRNGTMEAGEAPRAGDSLALYDGTGTYLAVTSTAADGSYSFSGLTPGATYRVAYASSTWWSIRKSLVPTTTDSLKPSRLAAATSVGVDFGWRPIVRAAPPAAPITSITGGSGLRVYSYDDVVPASDIYAALLKGTIGQEASSVLVRFDATSGSTTTSATVTGDDGRYSGFAATVNVTYESWLDNYDQTLSHEYGHAWTQYYTYLVQQDGTFGAYLQARGIAGDSRLGTSHAWTPAEMIAEDYRQLLGSTTAASGTQENRDIPAAGTVAGLRDWFLTTFTGSGTTTATASPSPSASAALSPEPSSLPTASPSASPSPSPSSTPIASTTSPSPTSSPTATKTRTTSGGCKRC